MSNINIQPLGSRVLVMLLVEESARSKSGLYVPETASESPQAGHVVAVGDDDDIKVEIGQKILFPKNTGTAIKLDNIEHLILDADEILAIVKD